MPIRARSYTIDAETEPRRYTPSSFRVRRPWERVSTRTSQPSARSSRRRVRTEATTPLTTGSHQSVVSSTRRGRPEAVADGSGRFVFAFTPRGSHPEPAIASPERMRGLRPWSDPRARRVLRAVLASMVRAYGRAPGATMWHARPVAGSFPPPGLSAAHLVSRGERGRGELLGEDREPGGDVRGVRSDPEALHGQGVHGELVAVRGPRRRFGAVVAGVAEVVGRLEQRGVVPGHAEGQRRGRGGDVPGHPVPEAGARGSVRVVAGHGEGAGALRGAGPGEVGGEVLPAEGGHQLLGRDLGAVGSGVRTDGE